MLVVKLTVDIAADVRPGDIVEMPNLDSYLVTRSRRQLRGKHVGRQHLHCVALDRFADHTGHTVHRID